MRTMSIIKTGTLAGAGIVGGLAAFSSFTARRVERRHPPQGRFVDVDGARLHYVDVGSGPTIVLVHGLTGQLGNFTYALTERLAADFRVIAVDRPGSGYSTYNRAGGRGLDAQGLILGKFITALRLDRPLLVGHSLGGAVSLALALQDAPLLGGLALLAPLTQPMSDAPTVFKPLYHPSPLRRALIAHTLATPLSRLKRDQTLAKVFGPDPVPADFVEKGGGILSARPRAFYAASSEASGGIDDLVEMAALYPTLRLPVGILYGRDDGILSPDLHGRLTAAMIPGAEYEVIAGGHMIPVTAPDAVAQWLRRQAARQLRA